MNARARPLLALLACAGLATGVARAADARIGEWIGRVDQPLPSGYRHLAGTCLGEGEDLCGRAITVLRDEQSGRRVLLATRRLLALDGNTIGGQRPHALVTDAWEVDALDEPAMEMTVGLCQRDGADDPRIVAIIRPDVALEWYVEFARLWRLDAQGRLQAIPARGVRCLNEGFGYDG